MASLLPRTSIARINNEVRRLDATNNLERRALAQALLSEEFKDSAVEQLRSIPSAILSIERTVIPKETLIQEGLRRLRESRSYSASYDVISSLLMPIVPDLDKEQIKDLAVTLTTNPDARGTYAMPELLRALFDTHRIGKLGDEEDWTEIVTKAERSGPMSAEYRDELIREIRAKYSFEGEF